MATAYSGLLGQGIVPNSDIGAELTAITRRGFIQSLVVQIYQASPTIAAMLDNAQTAYGGISSITIPVQGNPMTQTQAIDYSGSFNQPKETQAIYAAELNLCGVGTPLQFLGAEAALQLDHTVINRLEAKMNDATNSAVDFISTGLFNNYTDSLQITGFPGAIDDGTNAATYATINRSTYPFWQAYVKNQGSVNPTRLTVMANVTGVQKFSGGEVPTMGVCGAGTWQLLAQDFLGLESYQITPGTGFDKEPDGARSGFRALMVAGVPIYIDQYCPEGTIYMLNTNYTNMYVHEQASFGFTGFQSLISNFQLGYVGLVLTYLQLACAKPKANGRIYGYNYLSL